MITTAELNELYRIESERRGMSCRRKTAEEILRGHTAFIGTPRTLARSKPPAADFKDAGAGI